MKDDRIEIINVDLNLDLDKEIKDKVKNISADINLYTADILKNTTAGNIVQKVTSKRTELKLKDDQMQNVFKMLIDALPKENPWVLADELVKISGSNSQNQFTNRFKNWLKKDDKWIITKIKKQGKSYFSLQRFGS